MPGSATSSFTDAGAYREALSDLIGAFVVTSPNAFKAQIAVDTLQHLRLLRAREILPRIAYVVLPPERVFISFAAEPASRIFWRGRALAPDEIMLHACGERLHQRVEAAASWSFISLSTASLAAFTSVAGGQARLLARHTEILRPQPRDRKRLLRMHNAAMTLAETRPKILSHPEVVRAMEQQLGEAVAACLADAEVRHETAATSRGGELMVRFESLLAGAEQPGPDLAPICAALGVNTRTFQGYCLKCLGIGPVRYMRLRRLNRVRAAILDADREPARIAGLARDAGFTEPGRFAASYRSAFGEMPSMTLRRVGRG